jgi:two-component system, OmpR family, response regulator
MPPTLLVVDDNKELLAVLTQLLEESGFVVAPFPKGKPALEAARGLKPALAILDVLLPDMMGFPLAEALRGIFPNMPILFMTGVFKGGKHAEEVRTKFGSAHYFEKPFDAKQLIAAVKQLAPVAPQPVSPPTASSLDSFNFDLDVDVESEEAMDPMELTGKIKVTGGGNISAELSGAALHAAAPARGPIAGQRPPRPPPAALAEAMPVPKAGIRTGSLGDTLPGLINAFYLAKETGELQVQKGKVKKVVYFERGTPVFALSNLAADRFGQFLVRVGKIKPEQLEDVAVVARSSGRRTGDVLVERGLLRETERLYYIGQQVKAVIYSLFGWDEGEFVLSFRDKARGEAIKLDVHPGNLIIRGVKKLYKPDRLKRLAPPEDRLIPSQQPAYALNELELEKWEAQLLPRIDGNRTNAEVVAIASKPEHQVQAFLVAMLGLSILERRQ